mgnify:CR=1 FL=1
MFGLFWNIFSKFAVDKLPKKNTMPEPLKQKFYIDISKWNGVIDFAKVKTNEPLIDGVIIRATNGLNKTDEKFLANAKGCIDNNIAWGAYHFAQFTQDAAHQALKFLVTIQKAGGKPTLPLVLDVETNEKTLPINAAQLEKFCIDFLTVIETNTCGYDIAIYMSPGFSWFFPKNHKLGKYKLWAADYTGNINPVNGWKKVWLHQYSDKGKVSGIGTNVDLNRTIV